MAARHAEVMHGDTRSEPRDEVYYRARAVGPGGQPLQVLVVNMSAGGLRMRSDLPVQPGDRFRVTLPVVGAVDTEVRWSLGGRIGCQLVRPIPLADYYNLLAALVRGR